MAETKKQAPFTISQKSVFPNRLRNSGLTKVRQRLDNDSSAVFFSNRLKMRKNPVPFSRNDGYLSRFNILEKTALCGFFLSFPPCSLPQRSKFFGRPHRASCMIIADSFLNIPGARGVIAGYRCVGFTAAEPLYDGREFRVGDFHKKYRQK